MNTTSRATNRWLPLLLILLTVVAAATVIVTIWPPVN